MSRMSASPQPQDSASPKPHESASPQPHDSALTQPHDYPARPRGYTDRKKASIETTFTLLMGGQITAV